MRRRPRPAPPALPATTSARRRPSRRSGGRRRTPLPELLRQILAAGLALTAAVLLLSSRADPKLTTRVVLVATHDLDAGTILRPTDLEPAELVGDPLPGGEFGAEDDLSGRVVVGGLAAGEPVTERRLLDPETPFGVPDGLTPVVVAVSDPATLIPLRPGMCVDVYAGPFGAPLEPVATNAYFAAILQIDATSATGALGGGAPAPRSHAVIAVTHHDLANILESLSSDLIFASVCPA